MKFSATAPDTVDVFIITEGKLDPAEAEQKVRGRVEAVAADLLAGPPPKVNIKGRQTR